MIYFSLNKDLQPGRKASVVLYGEGMGKRKRENIELSFGGRTRINRLCCRDRGLNFNNSLVLNLTMIFMIISL